MPSDMNRLMQMVALMERQTAAVAAAEEELKSAKDALLRTQREDLPELMKELELTELRKEDGTTIRITNGLDISIPAAQRRAAFDWLIEEGYGGLIKAQCTVTFSATEREQAVACYDELVQARYPALLDEKIAPQTLKAWAKEQLAAGKEIPAHLFSLNPYDWAKIQIPKKGEK